MSPLLAFVVSNEQLKCLIEYVLDNGYVNCGMPDGGVVDIRKHNPLVTNPFFNILNVAEIRKKWNLKEVLSEFSQHKSEWENRAPKHLLKGRYEYDYYEPYVPFFIWLAVNFKTLYLNASVHSDGLSTILYDHLDNPFLYHSWYSRFYGADDFHTERIHSLYSEVAGQKVVYKSRGMRKWIGKFDKAGMKYIYPYKYRIEKKLRNLQLGRGFS